MYGNELERVKNWGWNNSRLFEKYKCSGQNATDNEIMSEGEDHVLIKSADAKNLK